MKNGVHFRKRGSCTPLVVWRGLVCEKGAFVDAATRVGVDDDGVWSVGGVAVHCFLGSVFPCPHINVLFTLAPISGALAAGIFGDEVAANGGDVEACSWGEGAAVFWVGDSEGDGVVPGAVTAGEFVDCFSFIRRIVCWPGDSSGVVVVGCDVVVVFPSVEGELDVIDFFVICVCRGCWGYGQTEACDTDGRSKNYGEFPWRHHRRFVPF